MPNKIEAKLCDKKSVRPRLKLCNNLTPMAVTTKAGPAFTKNSNILLACDSEINFFSKRFAIPMAPTG